LNESRPLFVAVNIHKNSPRTASLVFVICTMGNKTSTLASIHDSLLDGTISLKNVGGNESIQALDAMQEVIAVSVGKFDKLSSKEKKMMCSICNVLGNTQFFAGASTNNIGSDNNTSKALLVICRLKVLAILNDMLSVGFIAKKEFENCFSSGIRKLVERDDVDPDVLSLVLSCVVTGISAMDDNHAALQVCVRCQSMYPSMMSSVLKSFKHLSASSDDERAAEISHAQYYPLLRLFDHYSWILTQNSASNLKAAMSSLMSSSTVSSLTATILGLIATNLNSLSKLAVIDVPSVSYAACGLIFFLIKEKAKSILLMIQDECRKNGLLLQAFAKIVRDLTSDIHQTTSNSYTESPRANETQFRRPLCMLLGSVRSQFSTGPWGACVEFVTGEIQTDMLKSIVCALCIGCDDNSSFLLRSLPKGFKHLLFSDAPITKFVGWTGSAQSSESAVENVNSANNSGDDATASTPDSMSVVDPTKRKPFSTGIVNTSRSSPYPNQLRSPQQQLATSMLLHVSGIASSIGHTKGNAWHVVFDQLLASHVSTPLLIWNPDMLFLLNSRLQQCVEAYGRSSQRFVPVNVHSSL
jgi:hypothetical protein